MNITSSNSFHQGGTFRWMSPELFDPEEFGLKDSHPSKHSDCYALGMVIYEVLSRKVPFHQYADFTVVVKVCKGERPRRPQGGEQVWFVDDIWSILGYCWESNPSDRPRIEGVLQCLEKVSSSWTLPSPQIISTPPATNPSTWHSSLSTEESMDEDDIPPHSQIVASQPLLELLPKGDPNVMVPTLLLINL